MESFKYFLDSLSGFIWGPVMLVLLLGTGLYLTIGLRGLTFFRFPLGVAMLWGSATGKKDTGKGDISPFTALMTAMAATVGTGNIAGVGTAIFLGGPGAIFWMWVTALVGMAIKFAEAALAVHFREVDALGNHVGGPMYYIKNGLGARWAWLGTAFAFFGMVAAFGIGNTIQANSVAHVVSSVLEIPAIVTGLVLAVLTFVVIVGGIQRLGEVTSRLVPFMAAVYVIGALVIILANIEALPGAVGLIVSDAFTGTAAAGGFAGSSVMMAIRFGVARGIFSNEAGLGTAPMAHAAARVGHPVRQGLLAMLGTFLDTIIICSMTALVIVMSGAWQSGETGAALSAHAFEVGLPGFGDYVVTFGLIIFAYSTLLGWGFYGERCAEYLFGVKVIPFYRLVWVAAIPIGAMASLDLLWLIADIMNGFMALPNLLALLLLSPVVFKLARDYFAKADGK